ncbi:MAG: DUF6514 family protein [Oscillospiraceae bacterium]|jgi:hypothetical protein|nr:DUF6514 family protein [Oscillospiraceae bacterium]
MRKVFTYRVITDETMNAVGEIVRVYGLKITSELFGDGAELHGITRCAHCAERLRNTLARYNVTPTHASDVVRDLLHARIRAVAVRAEARG